MDVDEISPHGKYAWNKFLRHNPSSNWLTVVKENRTKRQSFSAIFTTLCSGNKIVIVALLKAECIVVQVALNSILLGGPKKEQLLLITISWITYDFSTSLSVYLLYDVIGIYNIQ